MSSENPSPSPSPSPSCTAVTPWSTVALPGRFIVLEGGDGCGKTTQIQYLQHWLRQSGWLPPGRSLWLTKEPGGTELGRTLRSLLLDPQALGEALADQGELFLYGADRAQHVQTLLRPWLEQGDWVLCDRYVGSTVAYQGYGRGLDLGLIQQINDLATGGLEADLTLWLDVEVSQCWQRLQGRGQADRMEAAQGDFAHRVRRGFLDLAAQYPDSWVRIDGEGREAIVAQRIQQVVQRWLESKARLQSHPDNPEPG
nr:dTMP kinase [Prochlorothrix hollandica]